MKDLADIPYPDFSDFNLDEYGLIDRMLPITTSRGCVARCRFCSESIFMNKFRTMNARRVVDEIQNGVDRYNTRFFRFNDSLINVDINILEEWLDEVLDRNLKIVFGGMQARIDSRLSSELLCKLEKAGCQLVIYGVETGSDRLLKVMKKRITVQEARNTINNTSAAGIAIQVNIIVGHFEETWLDFWQTLLFVFKIGKDVVYISVNRYGFTEGSYDYKSAKDIICMGSHRWKTRRGFNNYAVRTIKKVIVLTAMKVLRIKVP